MASGWVAPAKLGGSSLDAVGIAVDAGGNIFCGMGCDDWTAAYRVNPRTGQSDYNQHSERGSILKFSPDGRQRESLCSGLRWPVALAFNEASIM